MKHLLLLVTLILCGCDGYRSDRIGDFTCTPAQLKQVELEFNICIQSEYLSSICFLQAKKSYCTRVDNIQETP